MTIKNRKKVPREVSSMDGFRVIDVCQQTGAALVYWKDGVTAEWVKLVRDGKALRIGAGSIAK